MAWRHALDKYKFGPKFGVVDSWHPNGHRGTDYNGFPGGTSLRAVQDGTIVVNKWSDGLGNVVVLEVEGPHGKETKKLYFGYAHLDKPSPLAVGTKVKSGQRIGGAGTTGKFSSGVHLHLTLSQIKDGIFAGKVYDAHGYLERRIAQQKVA
jgi:murein DD-endopeptidase MepM/ murein hydrolase activator NlpD